MASEPSISSRRPSGRSGRRRATPTWRVHWEKRADSIAAISPSKPAP